MFWQIELQPRSGIPRVLSLISPFISIAIALFFGAILLGLLRINPFTAYKAIFEAAFLGGWFALSDTAVKTIPLIFTGLACALAYRARLWNIGAEGQLFLGAWAAAGVASFWVPWPIPMWSRLLLMAFAACTAGALWALLAAFMKTRFSVNEIISTLMLVYIAVEFNNYWIYGPWSDRGFQMTPMFPKSAWLPRLTDLSASYPSFSGLTVHLGLPIALILAFLLWWILKFTTWGFELKVMGDSQKSARYAGISLNRNTLVVMMISGALAGLAGMSEVSGVVHRLQEQFSPGFGFTAIIITFLAKHHPLGVVLVAFLFGGLLVGAKEIQPSGIPLLLQGTILFVVITWETMLKYKIIISGNKHKDK